MLYLSQIVRYGQMREFVFNQNKTHKIFYGIYTLNIFTIIKAMAQFSR